MFRIARKLKNGKVSIAAPEFEVLDDCLKRLKSENALVSKEEFESDWIEENQDGEWTKILTSNIS